MIISIIACKRRKVQLPQETAASSNQENIHWLRQVTIYIVHAYHTLADVCVASICLSNEAPLVRTISLATGSRVKAFSDAVRSRDDRCIISGRPVMRINDISFYDGFEAAHVFPLAYEGHWRDQNLSRWITQGPIIGGAINSVQNGLLLASDIHQLFDNYSLSINPDVCEISLYPALGLTVI